MAYKRLNKKKAVNTDSGEVLNRKTAIELIEEEYQGITFRLNQEVEALGGTSFYFVKKRYDRIYIVKEVKIEEGAYTKMYNKKFQFMIEKSMLSKNARCFLFTVEPYISYIESTIVCGGFNPTYEKLMTMMDMSKPTLMNTLAELEQLQIIYRKQLNGNLVICINPYLLSSGKIVKRETFDLFETSQWKD